MGVWEGMMAARMVVRALLLLVLVFVLVALLSPCAATAWVKVGVPVSLALSPQEHAQGGQGAKVSIDHHG